MHAKNDVSVGLVYGLGATLLWGSYPLWYKPLASLSAYHLLSWRIVFAEFFLVVLIVATNRLTVLRSTLKSIRLVNVVTVAGVLGLWWLMYIYGIMHGRVLEVAFGYFLSPIMSMVVSRVMFREQLTSSQVVAFILACGGVVLMAFELLNLHSFPWIAIIIGFCYSFYGIFKKKVPGDPLVVQSLEILMMLPFALIFLFVTHGQGEGHVFLESDSTDLLLMATGLITVLPLWWYSRAAKQLPMMTLSFLQFVPPTCNFLLAALVYHELVSPLKFGAFVLIWSALAIFTWDSIQKQRTLALQAALRS
jgi:chloramphenicol-sensitive protein RarD